MPLQRKRKAPKEWTRWFRPLPVCTGSCCHSARKEKVIVGTSLNRKIVTPGNGQLSSEVRYKGAGCFQGDDNQSEYVITSVTLRVLHIKHVASSMQAKYGISLLEGFSLKLRPILYFSNDKVNCIF